MATAETRVIVTTGSAGQANQAQVHHRDFPEIRAEGENPQAAAGQLVNHLTRALDSALTPWRRDDDREGDRRRPGIPEAAPCLNGRPSPVSVGSAMRTIFGEHYRNRWSAWRTLR